LFEHRKGLIESLQWNLDAKAVSIRIGYPKFDDETLFWENVFVF